VEEGSFNPNDSFPSRARITNNEGEFAAHKNVADARRS
jgi:hypothetical protein